jgi:FkbM family methyltransferase
VNRQTPRLLAGILRCPELGWRAGLALLAAKAARGIGVRRDVEVRLRRSRIWLGRDSFATDWNVFVEIFVGRAYAGIDYRGADVLDAGAHKGYFAVFALANGARTVTSLEPEPENFRLLARAAAGDQNWRARRQAVAGAVGTRSLRLGLAYSHSLVLEPGGGGAVDVEAVTLGDLLRETRGRPSIAKLDVEGAECEILSATPAESLAAVSALVVEAHLGAPCGPDDLARLAERAGLRRLAGPDRPGLLTFVRPAGAA